MNYTALAATSKDLITKFGQSVTLVKLSDGSFDGVLGAYTGQTSTSYTVKATIDNYKDSMIDGSMVLMGDKLAYIDSTTAPEIDNVLTVNSVDHKIINVKTIKPAGTVVYYEAQIRL